MRIELMGRNIEAGSKEQEEMKVGRITLSGRVMAGIAVLAEEAYWELHSRFCDCDKTSCFRTYLAIVACIAESNPPLAMDLICNLLKDKDCEETWAKVIAFIPKEPEHVAFFVNHFSAMLIHELIDEEEWEDEEV